MDDLDILESRREFITNLDYPCFSGGDTMLINLLKRSPIEPEKVKFWVEEMEVNVNVAHLPPRTLLNPLGRVDKESLDSFMPLIKKEASLLPKLDPWVVQWPTNDPFGNTSHITTYSGLSALEIAILKKENEIASSLIKAGADVNFKSLHLNQEMSKEMKVQYFGREEDPQLPFYGVTPLMFACYTK